MARIANEISGMRGGLHRHGVYSLFSANDVNTFLSAPHSAHCFAIRREGLAFRDVYQSAGSGSCGFTALAISCIMGRTRVALFLLRITIANLRPFRFCW